MAKRRNEENDERRRSRKEILLERKQRRQTRQVRIAVGAVVGILVLLFLVAIVNEYILRPRQAVAEVNGNTVTLSNWQDRVRYQRAQFIIALEEQYANFQDIGLIQQFNQQQISLLQQPEVLGELILEQMVNEELLRQAAAERDITVGDDEVDEFIAERFNYFGGESPTPFPTPTETIMPTPSLTPIPTEVITEVVPTNTPFPTVPAGPTGTPAPTATPVSEAAFQEEYASLIDQYKSMGVSEETYREAIRAQLYREKVADALAEDEGLTTEAEQASLYVLSFTDETAANEALDQIEAEDFLTVWNEMRSLPADQRVDGSAREVLWQTQDQLSQQFGPDVANAAFELSLDTPSEVLVEVSEPPAATQDPAQEQQQLISYYIIQVSGREVRDLSASTVDNQKQQLVSDLIQQRRDEAAIETFPVWRSRVPTQPILDPIFLTPPTQQAVPQQPQVTAPAVQPETSDQ